MYCCTVPTNCKLQTVPVLLTVLPLQLAKSAPVWNPVIYVYMNKQVNVYMNKQVNVYMNKQVNVYINIQIHMYTIYMNKTIKLEGM